MAEVDEIKRSPTFFGSTETPYNGFYGWEHGYFGHIAKSGKIELRRLELHGCASHPPGRYSATGGALGRALVRFARPNAPHTQQNRQKLGFCAPPPKPAWVPDSTSASWHQNRRLAPSHPRAPTSIPSDSTSTPGSRPLHDFAPHGALWHRRSSALGRTSEKAVLPS